MNAGLPELVGSEAQVSWAEAIRTERLEKLDRAIEELRHASEELRPSGHDRTVLRGPASMVRPAGDLEGLSARVRRANRAAWWIDWRDTPFDMIPRFQLPR